MSSPTPPPLPQPVPPPVSGPPPAPLQMQLPPPAHPPTPTVAFQLAWLPQEQDWVEAFGAVGRLQRRRTLTILLPAPTLLVILGLLSRDATTIIMGIALALFLVALLIPGRRQAVRSAVRRSPALQTYREVQVSHESGITEWFPGSLSMNAWFRWKAVLETERTFVLVLGDVRGNPILALAKRGLPPGVDPRLLGDFLRAHIGGPIAP